MKKQAHKRNQKNKIYFLWIYFNSLITVYFFFLNAPNV